MGGVSQTGDLVSYHMKENDMATTRNLDLWLEVLDRPIFAETEDNRWANDCVERLIEGRRLNQRDILNLMGLIDAVSHYEQERGE
jgi:hypothetical protein